ncbi:MAG: methylated-DNA--[protein]-cysteine S-methyltransferase [Deltaproteobacteria bacterium]|nr:methylated-DNA--[protein]-cysteine S-methyltransferase [Deltaproteobacteria bacterium]MBW2360876.1 methylated-DNA--[protein]-cysteine S-methyltransferase [Deltaproteobacteria bacterium]
MEIVLTTAIESPIGGMRLAFTERGLAYVELPHASGRGLDGWLRCCVPDAMVREGSAPSRGAAKQIVEYLNGKRLDFDLVLDPLGTPFQRKVWDALLEIPYGETCSYRDIAKRIRMPNAVRAVGTANGANPLSLVVPCHRVINSGGGLGGYGGGLALKRRLLAMEQGQQPSQGCLL